MSCFTSTMLFTLTFLLSTLTLATSHNITQILSTLPQYSTYNSLLTQTKLADEINSRQTITVLVINNNAISSLTSNHSLSTIKNALSLHVLLDYYDLTKLHQLPKGTTLTTTLYQTTGNAKGNSGFVNITDIRGGKVAFGSASGSDLDSTFAKSVKTIEYNISVVEISKPIIAPGITDAEGNDNANLNVTALFEKAGCKTFAALVTGTGVIKIFNEDIESGKGLTIFAPNDEAFKAKGVPDFGKLKSGEVVEVLRYHAAQGYNPIGSLKSANGPIATLAKDELRVKTAGDSVSLVTGVGTSRVASTIIDSTPVIIFSVDSVLLPSDVFGNAPSLAPGLEPVMAPSPGTVIAPSPGPMVAKAPSPMPASPPAPPTMMTPEGAPGAAESPGPVSDNATSGSENTHVKMFQVVYSMAASVILSMFLS